jgi:hypothetical protein
MSEKEGVVSPKLAAPMLPSTLLEKVEVWSLSRLTPYANNPKNHTPEQIEEIARSITEFGFLVPILVNSDGEIIAGHGRMLASFHLELEEVPVLIADHLSPEQVQAYRITDNRLAEKADWDYSRLQEELKSLQDRGVDLLLTGFSEFDLKHLTADEFIPGAELEEAPWMSQTRDGRTTQKKKTQGVVEFSILVPEEENIEEIMELLDQVEKLGGKVKRED